MLWIIMDNLTDCEFNVSKMDPVKYLFQYFFAVILKKCS